MKQNFEKPNIIKIAEPKFDIGPFSGSSGGRSGMGMCKNTYTYSKTKQRNK